MSECSAQALASKVPSVARRCILFWAYLKFYPEAQNLSLFSPASRITENNLSGPWHIPCLVKRHLPEFISECVIENRIGKLEQCSEPAQARIDLSEYIALDRFDNQGRRLTRFGRAPDRQVDGLKLTVILGGLSIALHLAAIKQAALHRAIGCACVYM